MCNGNLTSVTCIVMYFFNCMITGSFSIGLAHHSVCHYSPSELLCSTLSILSERCLFIQENLFLLPPHQIFIKSYGVLTSNTVSLASSHPHILIFHLVLNLSSPIKTEAKLFFFFCSAFPRFRCFPISALISWQLVPSIPLFQLFSFYPHDLFFHLIWKTMAHLIISQVLPVTFPLQAVGKGV